MLKLSSEKPTVPIKSSPSVETGSTAPIASAPPGLPAPNHLNPVFASPPHPDILQAHFHALPVQQTYYTVT